MGVSLEQAAQLVPWAMLVVWWFALLGFRRRRGHWLRSTPVAVGLVVTTIAADVSAVLATGRMSAAHGQSLAMGLLWIACLLSITTFLVLRAPRDDGEDDGGGSPPDEPPEPPWWPEFERDFRDYARRRASPPPRGPRPPVGVK